MAHCKYKLNCISENNSSSLKLINSFSENITVSNESNDNLAVITTTLAHNMDTTDNGGVSGGTQISPRVSPNEQNPAVSMINEQTVNNFNSSVANNKYYYSSLLGITTKEDEEQWCRRSDPTSTAKITGQLGIESKRNARNNSNIVMSQNNDHGKDKTFNEQYNSFLLANSNEYNDTMTVLAAMVDHNKDITGIGGDSGGMQISPRASPNKQTRLCLWLMGRDKKKFPKSLVIMVVPNLENDTWCY